MLEPGQKAPETRAIKPAGAPLLVVFFETGCPACRLTFPYLNALARDGANVIAISQDDERSTADFRAAMETVFPVIRDDGLALSRAYDPVAVPCLFLLNPDGCVASALVGFDKSGLNEIAALLGKGPVAGDTDGAPARKPGCVSRHRESPSEGETAPALNLYARRGARASRIELSDSEDLFAYCAREFGDPLPVIPPTVERVERMLAAAAPLEPAEVIGLIPPCYGAATVEKIAANAVMAGCEPAMMRVLVPLVRAACDERFNIHGVQATTHFAAPLILVNGPVRKELGFARGQNVFSNVAHANSSLGRALQLLLVNLGGARPDRIDMSTLGNPGKFSYCIAENEEESPWEPYHAASAVTLMAAEPPRGVSEHNARTARGVLNAIRHTLATIWNYRACLGFDALVVVCPEHARTIHRDGFSKQDARDYLFENTGTPVREYEAESGEGAGLTAHYEEVRIGGEPCYRKFRAPEAIAIAVAGGTAGKFSAVIGSWAAGPRGSQMVTYPCP